MSALLIGRSRVGFRGIAAGLLLGATLLATGRTVTAQTVVDGIGIEMVPVSGVPGDSVEMAVVLHAGDEDVAGIQIDVEAAPPLTIGLTEAGRPDCWRNTELNKDYTVYSFRPAYDDQWERMRGLVLSLTNVDPIPDGSLLFTCRIDIAADAEPGEYQLVALRLGGSTPDGVEIAAVGSGGLVLVADPDEGSVPLVEGTHQASGGCAIGAAKHGVPSAIFLALPLALWRFRRGAHRPHE